VSRACSAGLVAFKLSAKPHTPCCRWRCVITNTPTPGTPRRCSPTGAAASTSTTSWPTCTQPLSCSAGVCLWLLCRWTAFGVLAWRWSCQLTAAPCPSPRLTHNRRLGARGLQAVAADPGAVRTNIYNNSPKLGKGFIKAMIDNCYAPPEDGAQVQCCVCRVGCSWRKHTPCAPW
jgi:hypothetical protein